MFVKLIINGIINLVLRSRAVFLNLFWFTAPYLTKKQRTLEAKDGKKIQYLAALLALDLFNAPSVSKHPG